jgi:hypothetical protein
VLLPADGDGLDLLGYVEFQRNYRWVVVVVWHHCTYYVLHLQPCSTHIGSVVVFCSLLYLQVLLHGQSCK